MFEKLIFSSVGLGSDNWIEVIETQMETVKNYLLKAIPIKFMIKISST